MISDVAAVVACVVAAEAVALERRVADLVVVLAVRAAVAVGAATSVVIKAWAAAPGEAAAAASVAKAAAAGAAATAVTVVPVVGAAQVVLGAVRHRCEVLAVWVSAAALSIFR